MKASRQSELAVSVSVSVSFPIQCLHEQSVGWNWKKKREKLDQQHGSLDARVWWLVSLPLWSALQCLNILVDWQLTGYQMFMVPQRNPNIDDLDFTSSATHFCFLVKCLDSYRIYWHSIWERHSLSTENQSLERRSFSENNLWMFF